MWDHFAFTRSVRDCGLPPAQRHVLLALASRSDNRTGEVNHTSYQTLANDTGMHRTTVIRTIEALLQTDHLSATKRHGATSTYQLHYATPQSQDTTGGESQLVAQCDGGSSTALPALVAQCDGGSSTALPIVPLSTSLPLSTEGEHPPQQLALESTEADEPKAQAKPKKKTPPQGSRLPENWILPRPWGTWALGAGLTEPEVRLEAEKFRDHFIAAPGRHGRKTNWKATWRNWIRKRDEFNHKKRPTQTQGPAPATKTAAEYEAEADRLYQAQLAKKPGRRMGPTQEQLAGFDAEAAKKRIDAELAAKEAARKAETTQEQAP